MTASTPASPRTQNLIRLLDRNFEKPLIAVLLLMSLCLVTYQVFFRYILAGVFGIVGNTAWAEELAITCFIWAVFLGAALGVRQQKTIRISGLVDKAPPRWKNMLITFDELAFLAVAVLCCKTSWVYLKDLALFPSVTSALGIPQQYPQSILVIGFAVIALRLIQRLICLFWEQPLLDSVLGVILTLILSLPFFFTPEVNEVASLLITLIGGLLLGIPVCATLILASLIALFSAGTPFQAGQVGNIYSGLNTFPTLAIFFFVSAGLIMVEIGLSQDLFNVADPLVGRYYGGIGLAAILTSIFFGAVTGAAVATVAAIGTMTVPSMVERGYDKAFAAALVACAGIIGVLIPPSNPFVTYGVMSQASISKLFIAGIVPGFLCAGVLMVITWYTARKNNWRGTDTSFSLAVFSKAIWKAKYALFIPVLILGGIYGGIMTPTEASAVSVVYSLLVGIVAYRSISWSNAIRILSTAAVSSAVIVILIGMAQVFAHTLTLQQLPQKIALLMADITANKFLLLLVINLLLLVLGAFMDAVIIIILLTPILFPLISAAGIDPIHFGVIVCLNTSIGLITPPIGSNLFVANIVSDVPVDKIARNALPFLAGLIVLLGVITYVPQISLFLVEAMQ